MKVRYNMPTIRIGRKFISGRDNLNQRLWDEGYIVSVYMGCFILYDPPNSRKINKP